MQLVIGRRASGHLVSKQALRVLAQVDLKDTEFKSNKNLVEESECLTMVKNPKSADQHIKSMQYSTHAIQHPLTFLIIFNDVYSAASTMPATVKTPPIMAHDVVRKWYQGFLTTFTRTCRSNG